MKLHLKIQCWEKLLVKVMHCNIVLLYKKATNCIMWLISMESNALQHVTFVLLFVT